MATVNRGQMTILGLGLWGALSSAGCGLGGGGSTLQVSSFPQSGLGPFRLLLPEEAPALDAPYVLLTPGLDVDEPEVLQDDTGLRFFVWAQRRGTQAPFLAQAHAPSLIEGAGDPERIFGADQPWEDGVVRHPTVLRGVPGLPRYALFYQGRDGSLGLALSEDGQDFRKLPAPLLAAATVPGTGDLEASPVLLEEEARLRVYLMRQGTQLFRAEVDVGQLAKAQGLLSWDLAPLSLTPADFTIPVSTSETQTADVLRGLRVRRILTPAGRPRFDLFVMAEGGPAGARRRTATAAAAYDGLRFAGVVRPFLGRTTGVLSAPTVMTDKDSGRAVLFVGFRRGDGAQGGIAAGQIP